MARHDALLNSRRDAASLPRRKHWMIGLPRPAYLPSIDPKSTDISPATTRRLALVILTFGAMRTTGATCAQPAPPPRPRDIGKSPAPVPDNPEDHPVRQLPQDELRARLRRCATRWSRMKRDGQTADLLWSDFSRACLQEK
jgi:hypothetical protein